MSINHELAALAKAVTDQCGMLASYREMNHRSGVTTTAVSVCTVPDSTAAAYEDWRWFEASDDDGRKCMREELWQFIAANREEAVA